MSKNIVYEIKLNNWLKYNKTLKKGHSCILLSTGFLSDAKVRQLTPAGKLLLLSCLLVAGESVRSHDEVRLGPYPGHIVVSHESLAFQSGVKSQSVRSQLDQLQSLQILTYVQKEPFLELNGIERKGKRKEKIPNVSKKVPTQTSMMPVANAPPPADKVGKVLVAAYCELWKARYGDNPPIRPQDARALKTLGEAHGLEKTKLLLQAYLRMPDAWFVKKRHDLTTFSNSLNEIAHFATTGKVLTKREVNTIDQAVTNQNTLNQLREGKI